MKLDYFYLALDYFNLIFLNKNLATFKVKLNNFGMKFAKNLVTLI